MISVGQRDLVKYPFLPEAGEYLKDKGFDLEQLNDPDWKPIIDQACKRIEGACNSPGKYSAGWQQRQQDNDVLSYGGNLDIEILSFVICVIILKQVGVNALTRRFSLYEAQRAEKLLEADLKDLRDSNSSQIPLKLIQDLFSMKVEFDSEGNFVVPVSDYLKRAVNFHEKEWKLVNRKVRSGFVYLTRHETVRLIRAELDQYIFKKIQSVGAAKLPPIFDDYVGKVRQMASRFMPAAVGKETEITYPPCIKHAIEVLQNGQNLPHSGRFLLATYMLAKEKSVEEIVPFFQNAPDYSERVTRYQLNHLAGTSGQGTKYSCPSCEKIKSENLCFETQDCRGIFNPVQFRRKSNSKANNDNAGAGAQSQDASKEKQ